MSLGKTYPFDNALNYTFPSEIEVSGGEARLSLVDKLNQLWQQTFTNDIGFTYDSSKAEFTTGRVQQVDQTPLNSTFGVTYTSNINGNFGDGVLTGSATGGASVSGGKLDLTGGTIQYADYDANLNADSAEKGAFKFKYTPNYSGTPSTSQVILCNSKAPGDSDNEIVLFHDASGGTLSLFCRDSTGGITISAVSTSAWSPVASTEYEFEINYDYTLVASTIGNTRLFVDGINLAEDLVSLAGRDSDINLLRLGSSVIGGTTADFEIDDLIVYTEPQHTANYTPGYTLPEAKFVETKVELPQFSYVGIGSIQGFTNFYTTEGGSPKYIMNNLYYTTGWNTSDGSYTQANTKAEVLANIDTLPGNDLMDIDIIFPNSNTNSDVNALNLVYTGQEYTIGTYLSLFVDDTTSLEQLISYAASVTEPGSDTVRFRLYKSSTPYWFDGADWVVSTDAAESNTAAEINTNALTFTDVLVSMQIEVIFYSNDGTTTPSIDLITFSYDFASPEDDPHLTLIYGWSRNPDGTPNVVPFKIELSSDEIHYSQLTQARNLKLTIQPRLSGYWEVELLDTDNMPVGSYYTWTWGSKVETLLVPEQDTIPHNDLPVYSA